MRKNGGFTLIELIIVIAIVMIIVTFAVESWKENSTTRKIELSEEEWIESLYPILPLDHPEVVLVTRGLAETLIEEGGRILSSDSIVPAVLALVRKKVMWKDEGYIYITPELATDLDLDL